MDRSNRRRNRQMYSATCSECGKSCEVPFRPTGDKPVYCNECFKRIKGGGKKDFGQPRKGGSPEQRQSDHSHKEHAQIHAKLDRILSILQKIELPKEIIKEKVEIPKKEAKEEKPKAAKKAKAAKKTTKKATPKKTVKKTAKKTTKKK